MLNSCSSMHVKSQSCIVLFDLLLQQLYSILGQPSYILFWPKISAKMTDILAQDTSKMHKNVLRGTHKSKFSRGRSPNPPLQEGASPSHTLPRSCLRHSLCFSPDHFQICGDGPDITKFKYLFSTVKFLQPHRVIVELDEDSHMATITWQMKHNISCEIGLQHTVYWCTVDKSQGNQSYALCQV